MREARARWEHSDKAYERRDMSFDSERYAVVMNDEEQYSIWPADRQVPDGWQAVGVSGSKEECLAHIEKVWTDMRPLSLRRQLSEQSG
jgi:MbtH protein